MILWYNELIPKNINIMIEKPTESLSLEDFKKKLTEIVLAEDKNDNEKIDLMAQLTAKIYKDKNFSRRENISYVLSRAVDQLLHDDLPYKKDHVSAWLMGLYHEIACYLADDFEPKDFDSDNKDLIEETRENMI